MWRDAGISSFQCPTKVVSGIGAHEALAEIVRERAAKRLLVVLDPAIVNSAIHRKVAGILAHQDVATIVFNVHDADPRGSTVQAALESRRQHGVDPIGSTVQAALESRRQHGADGLLAIGGSGTIGVVQAIGSLMPSLPLIAVPTTAGAGSAVSSACSISILDPITVSSMPAHEAACAGIDAFVHAFESYLSKRATVFSDAVNLHAMTLIAGSIRAFVADRNNASAALDVLCGTSLAAMSFGVTEDRLDELARLSFASNCSASNPRETSEQDFRDLFGAAF